MLFFVSLAFSIHCAVLSYPSHLLDEEKMCYICVLVCLIHMKDEGYF